MVNSGESRRRRVGPLGYNRTCDRRRPPPPASAAELQGLAGVGVAGLDPESLCEVALAARRLRELADHVEVHALGALAETGHTEATTGLSAAGWFAREVKLPSEAGRAQVSTARALRHLPGTDQAWLDGRIGREHVRVLTAAANPRIREHIASLEDELIGIAEDRTFVRWRQRVAEVVAELDQDGPDPEDPTHTTASWGRSGLFAVLRAKFAGAEVELLEQIIEAETNRLFHVNVAEHAATIDLPLLSRSQLRAQAIIGLILHGPDTRTDPDDTDLPARRRTQRTRPTPTPTVRPTKVTARWTRRRGRRSRSGPRTRCGSGSPWCCVLATPRSPSCRPSAGSTWSLTNGEGQHLALEHFASLICDCAAHALLVDDGGTPFAQGRNARYASPTQRRVVIIRDGGCVMPGCDCPAAWVEIHHVIFHSNGGKTTIVNLVALCRRHHGITHRKGWSMHASGDGWFYWITPSGDSFWSQRYGRQRAGPTPNQIPIAA